MDLLGKRVSVLLILVFILMLGVIIVSTPRTENIYNNEINLYPNILNELDKITTINLQHKNFTLLLQKTADGFWKIANNDNFPAQTKVVNDLLFGIASLKIIEQKTKDPKLYSLLQVDDINKGKSNATAITFKDATEQVLVNLLVGKQNRSSVPKAKEQQLYVRKVGELASWLVEGYFPLSLEFKDWVVQPLLLLNSSDIKTMLITNNIAKEPIKLKKADNEETFYLQALRHKGKKNKTKAIAITASSLLYLLNNLEYNNVVAVKDLAKKWSADIKLELIMLHDFKLFIEFAKIKQHIYARIFTDINEQLNVNDIEVWKQYKQLDELSKVWAFQISDELYNFIYKPYDELVQFLKS